MSSKHNANLNVKIKELHNKIDDNLANETESIISIKYNF
jgi:hypothetical protein